MPTQLPFTAFLNHLLAGPVTAMLRALHIEPTYPQAPIPNFVAMEIVVILILTLLFVLVRSRLSVEKPGTLQHLFELVQGFVEDQSHEIIGHGGEAFTAFLTILFIFILLCNLLGLVPTLESPTGVPAVPLGFALVAFAYYNYHGIKKRGALGYAKHFLGPIWWLSPLMLPIELVSNLARLLSLTVRLWANMFAGDLITLVFFSLVPVLVPTIFMGLHIVVAVLQAYVFVLLTIIYLQGAVSEEH